MQYDKKIWINYECLIWKHQNMAIDQLLGSLQISSANIHVDQNKYIVSYNLSSWNQWIYLIIPPFSLLKKKNSLIQINSRFTMLKKTGSSTYDFLPLYIVLHNPFIIILKNNNFHKNFHNNWVDKFFQLVLTWTYYCHHIFTYHLKLDTLQLCNYL